MKYRKQPIAVEAEQFFPEVRPWPEGVERYEKERQEAVSGESSTWFGWRIATPEGPMEVTPGDWIITGVAGERYPCKPEIFAKTYEYDNGAPPVSQGWLIWNNEYRMWWCARRSGYTRFVDDAGRYSLADAQEILRQHPETFTDHEPNPIPRLCLHPSPELLDWIANNA